MTVGDIAMQEEANRQRTEEQAQARADAESEFQARKAAIVASIKAKRDAGRYEDALAEVARHATVSSDPVLAQLKTSVEEAARQTEAAACMASLAEKQAQYSSLFQQARFEEAAEVLKRCSVVTNAPELREKIAAALAQPYVRVLDDKTATLQDKQSALRSLDSISNAIAEPYQQVVRNLELKEEERRAAAERKRKKSEGVSIGMSKEDVLASNWGAPERINRTTTSYGVREQWVYGSQNYLYFQNDVLVTIQN
ncbi:hypothetical protein [Alicycliphilus denitrificans]|uniref:hypothetical protein n=1 Tax=Alicycliphilus denitrificans TaxID=179636 RepID=UPI0001D9F32C|nr:hypothetical protein [Alicycliphilus denitrificans]ADU99282.1 hypothetical protein Alide_1523 [Alicycliphilus denitrificans BC]